MGLTPDDRTSSSSAPAQQPGWFTRVPMWARIVVPVVLLLGVAAVVLVVVMRPSAPVEPVDAARSACQSAIREEIESHDVDVVEVSFFGVDATEDEVYLARGDAAFRDADGAVQRVQVRCTVRLVDGTMRAPSIRFSRPIDAG